MQAAQRGRKRHGDMKLVPRVPVGVQIHPYKALALRFAGGAISRDPNA
jgi:hypothetical protein